MWCVIKPVGMQCPGLAMLCPYLHTRLSLNICGMIKNGNRDKLYESASVQVWFRFSLSSLDRPVIHPREYNRCKT